MSPRGSVCCDATLGEDYLQHYGYRCSKPNLQRLKRFNSKNGAVASQLCRRSFAKHLGDRVGLIVRINRVLRRESPGGTQMLYCTNPANSVVCAPAACAGWAWNTICSVLGPNRVSGLDNKYGDTSRCLYCPRSFLPIGRTDPLVSSSPGTTTPHCSAATRPKLHVSPAVEPRDLAVATAGSQSYLRRNRCQKSNPN